MKNTIEKEVFGEISHISGEIWSDIFAKEVEFFKILSNITPQYFLVNPMLKLIETLRAKPSDRNIRIMRIIFAIILLGVIYFGFSKTYFEYSTVPKEVLYVLYIFPLIGLIRGIFDPGVFRRKIWKWTQVWLGIAMMTIAILLINTEMRIVSSGPVVSSSGSLSATALVSVVPMSSTASPIDTDFWIGFLGFWVSLFGLILTSKNITKKNERYGEIVKKIRV